MLFRTQSTALLQTIFDCLIDSFIADKVGLSNDFLSTQLAAHLKDNLLALYSDKQLLSAGIGNDSIQNHDKLIRNDKIYWLDRAHENVYEVQFFELMDSFIEYLNRTCYTGITGYEFHYTMYEKGSFYKKHLDQFRTNKSRAYSMIMYLNTDWLAKDGGELCVYHADYLQTIAPENGKCVFFKSSEMEHEVLITNAPRLSITGWLKTN
jgi:SM-20-related protein